MAAVRVLSYNHTRVCIVCLSLGAGTVVYFSGAIALSLFALRRPSLSSRCPHPTLPAATDCSVWLSSACGLALRARESLASASL